MSKINEIIKKCKELEILIRAVEQSQDKIQFEARTVVAIEYDGRDTYVFPDRPQEEAERIYRLMFPNKPYRVVAIPYRTYFRVREFYCLSDVTIN